MNLRDEEEEPLPFEGIDKATTIQESKHFNSSTLDTRKCKHTLIKILYLLSMGETVGGTEATELFFNTTKLLQSQDTSLRRLVYIMVKELSNCAEHVFVASNTLCKDMNSNNDMYKANAIRALRKIGDSSMMGPIERYLKQAVVDKADTVSSAAIVTGIHLSQTLPDMVKRWGGEVGEALKQHGVMAQYHALALLHKIRKNDKLSVSKLVQSVNTTPIRSPMALCLLIRMCTDVLKEDFEGSPDLSQFVVNSLKHCSEMVVFEAAKCICSLKNVSAKDLTPAILVLQLYLTSHKPVLRFAAVRLLNKVATTQPMAVTTCNIDMESLISDPNRHIATLAITTLLKTGSEFSIDRLMKQISTFVNDIADEFKVVVIDSMKLLCTKFPHKHNLLLSFLSDALREEGGYEFKKAIVDAIISMIDAIPQAKEEGLLQLCEFIEDCEFTLLSQRVLHLLGQLGPSSSNPQKYIRYIYNRVILEMPAVRAASVTALAKFAAHCVPLRQSIKVLLQRVMQDSDDEVRDRAVFYTNVLDSPEEEIKRFILDVSHHSNEKRRAKHHTEIQEVIKHEEVSNKNTEPNNDLAAAEQTQRANFKKIEKAVAALAKHPKLKQYGKPHKSSDPEHITDTEAEFVVTYMKHTYPDRIIIEFNVNNNMDDVVLEKVSVKMDGVLEGLDEAGVFPITSLKTGEIGSCYIVLNKEANVFPTGAMVSTLVFTMKEVDKDTGEPDSEGTEDEYQLEEVVVNVCDYVETHYVANFDKDWNELALEQTAETFTLSSMKNLQAAADEIVSFLGMQPHGGTKTVPPKTKSHTITLAGSICTAPPSILLVKARVFYSTENVVTLEFITRGGEEDVRVFLSQELAS
eukprot:NODE_416_length_2792_cov_57.571750_g357_i0.p1 GENE.NODE_416_length_2792_cov_57.571750_g357_i0~~NODE_416_length_2792_cov_57.571750_g357_i0.p1  ORF type:complete len:859 (+),score=167.60 NODE_416_length_2792_cov_57.571750_g357_i0:66-2642(+)